jgi:hypothetical protein
MDVAINEFHEFERIHWHDAILRGVSVNLKSNRSSDSPEMEFFIDSYLSNESSERSSFIISCWDVFGFSSVIDLVEMKGNEWAGNISNIYIKPGAGARECEGVLWVYLADGVISVSAARYSWLKVDL